MQLAVEIWICYEFWSFNLLLLLLGCWVGVGVGCNNKPISQFVSHQKHIEIVWNSFKIHNLRFKALSHVVNNPLMSHKVVHSNQRVKVSNTIEICFVYLLMAFLKHLQTNEAIKIVVYKLHKWKKYNLWIYNMIEPTLE